MLTRLFLPNLRARLVAIIFLALLPAFVLLLTISAVERTRAIENARVESMGIAQLTKSYYSDLIASTEQVLEWAALFEEIGGDDAEACNARLQQLFATLQDYRGLSVAEADGSVVCAAPMPSSPLNTSDRPYFQQVLERKAFVVGGFATDAASGRPALAFGYPILDRNGEVRRVVSASLSVEALTRRLGHSEFYDFVALIVMDKSGTVVLRYPDPEAYEGQNASDLPLFQEAVRYKQGYAEMVGLSNVMRQWAYTTIGAPDTPELYVMAGFTHEYILGGVNRVLRSTIFGLAIIGMVALIAAWLSAEEMIVRRTQRIVVAAERMRRGDLSARAGMADDISELGQLAHTFDEMAAALEQRETDNRELFEQMQRLNADLETRVIKRTEQLQTSNSRLLDSQAELHQLSRELVRVTEQERTRISREIHDQLGQLLTAIKMELRNIQKGIDPKNSEAATRLTGTVELVDETIRTVRRISTDLRPGLLDDFGLAAAIEGELQEWGARTNVEWTLDSDLDEDRLTRDMATAAFRILQEALTNVARHAEATRISVTLRTADDHFEAQVKDNGKGLPPPGPRSRSLGVLGMRERARQFGGVVELSTVAGEGVTLRLQFPIEPAAARHAA